MRLEGSAPLRAAILVVAGAGGVRCALPVRLIAHLVPLRTAWSVVAIAEPVTVPAAPKKESVVKPTPPGVIYP